VIEPVVTSLHRSAVDVVAANISKIVGVVIVGDVVKTTLPVPVEEVQDGAAEALPVPVCPRKDLVVDVFPASLATVANGEPLADAYRVSPIVVRTLSIFTFNLPLVCTASNSTSPATSTGSVSKGYGKKLGLPVFPDAAMVF
jgi:hypothetical protein